MPAKRKPQAKAKPKAKEGEVVGVPLYLVALLVILALVGGYALNLMLGPKSDTIEPKKQEIKPIKAQLLLSEDCKVCKRYNSFELALKASKINYTLEAVDVGSQEGRKLIADYKIAYVPTLFIDPASVDKRIKLRTNNNIEVPILDVLEQHRIKDKYVIPESDIGKETNAKMYLAPPKGCVDNAEQANVLLLYDLYCPGCLMGWAEIRKVAADFNNSVEFSFNYAPVAENQRLIAQFGKRRTERGMRNVLCAQEQGLAYEMADALIGVYCDKHNDFVSNDQEVIGCAIGNSRWGKPLSDADIEVRAYPNVPGLDANALKACEESEEISQKLVSASDTAKSYFVDTVPGIIVDCKLQVPIEQISEAICSLHPDFEKCKPAESAASNEPATVTTETVSLPAEGIQGEAD